MKKSVIIASLLILAVFSFSDLFQRPSLASAADYSGVYRSQVRGDRKADGLLKIEQTGTSVEVYMEWALPDPFPGTVLGATLTLDAGIILIFDESGETFTGTWVMGEDSGTISGYVVDSDMWSVPFKVEANSSKGFSLPYVLYVPYTVESKSTIFVEGLATPTHTDDMAIHLETGFSIAHNMMSFVRDLKTPLLIPIIPHTYDNHDDFQGLGRGALTSARENLVRVDLQLIAMIEDARNILKQMGIQTQEKVFMDGFSHSAQFANRFTILHPDRVQAAAIGAPGGWPVAPLTMWNSYTMNYPVGIADLSQLIGEQFNEEVYSTVPQYLYMGADDTNDAIGRFTTEEQVFLNSLGTTPYGRWPDAKTMYDSIGCNTVFVAYPGVEHTITDEMWVDISEFFKNNMPSSFPWASFLVPVLNRQQ